MTAQKIKPCPNCKSADYMNVYSYEQSGRRYVECDNCWYRGPGDSSVVKAIKAHNAAVMAGSDGTPVDQSALDALHS